MKKLQKGLPAGRQGFTLIELLIVVALLLLLSLIVFINLRGQSARANDIKRKTDLYNMRKAFEDYNNDHSVYPDQPAVANCGSADLVPYLTTIPCDPVSRTPYGYFPSANGGYRICAKLADTTDPAIAAAGCAGADGCGLGGGYNYCLGSGVTASAVGTVDQIGGGGSTPTPTPTPTPVYNPTFNVACTNSGECNVMSPLPYERGCPIAWESGCPVRGSRAACDVIANRCPIYP